MDYNDLKSLIEELAQKVTDLSSQVAASNQERLLDAKALIAMGIPRPAVYNLLNRADFPTVHIGRRKFVRSSKLYEFLDENGKQLDA